MAVARLAKLKGHMVVPKTADVGAPDGWSAFWVSGWDWTFTKAQIDLAIALGANIVRVGMPTNAVFTGGAGKTTAETNLATFCAYVKAAGLQLYATLRGGATDWGAASLATVGAAYQEQVGLLVGYGNIFAVEMVNEIDLAAANVAQAQTWLSTLKPYVRAASATVKTTSSFSRGPGATTLPTWIDGIAAYVEVQDFHPYDAVPTLADLIAYRLRSGYKSFIYGECGTPLSVGNAAQTAFTTAVGQVSAAPDCRGALAFCIDDYSAVAASQYGYYDSAGANPRSQLITPYGGWPTTFAVI